MPDIAPSLTGPTSDGVLLRAATASDVPVLDRFVRELAVAEDFPTPVTARPADLHAALFGPDAVCSAVLAEVDGVPVGFALHHPTYSTVTGRRGVHLEDLHVADGHRGRGIGLLLLGHLAAIAQCHGGRLDWTVLRTNTAAHRFYRRLGAREVTEVAGWRLDGTALRTLAG